MKNEDTEMVHVAFYMEQFDCQNVHSIGTDIFDTIFQNIGKSWDEKEQS